MSEQTALKHVGRNDPCWCGSGQKYKKCHLDSDKQREQPRAATLRPARTAHSSRPLSNTLREGSGIKTPTQIAGIRRAGRLAARTLDMLTERIVPGVTTEQINTWVHEFTLQAGAIPAPLNYKGFPKSVCTSINEVVCHGIPEDRALREGDIINVDVTPILDGYYGDSSRMYLVGQVSPAARRLVEVTRQCLERGIAQVRPGGHVGDIGHAIQTFAEGHKFSVVRDFVGHGTGVQFHEDPQIPHFGRPGRGPVLVPGMVFTIEPMINAGGWPVRILEDQWTAVTADGSLSAQFEHTVLVTEEGVEILTQ
ncbi:MAG: type I methionyl aminopeptidase [Deltaproteobacteria bacterium]|nr:type I methionyl aminopeptidase [Deltaproteobacteria bacterium]